MNSHQPSDHELPLHFLTRQGFAAFGDVIETEDARHFPINGGNTERFHDLCRLEPGTDGHIIASIFRGQARPLPFTVSMMERHPLGSQAFMPLHGRSYLVVVAPAGPAPQLTDLMAFLATGKQGVNYAPGVWHHPLLVLGQTSDFLVLDRAGPGGNCDEVLLDRAGVISLQAVTEMMKW